MERNIYKIGKELFITSDEEIKPNVYALINKVLCKTELLEGKIVSRQLVGGATMDICKSEYLEIILTTDQDLIKDGVQAIDDTFLEWFVKNPSCEEIEVDTLPDLQSWNESTHKCNNVYEIIIPKEEPKQTLEEAAFNNYKELYEGEPLTQDVPIDAFKDGAKWQQETLEKAMNENGYHDQTNDTLWREGVIFGAKWQAERVYSEEELKEICVKYHNMMCLYGNAKTQIWFEQFKKK